MKDYGEEKIFLKEKKLLKSVEIEPHDLRIRSTVELITLCSTICAHSATRHNIHMYPYFLFAAIHHLHRPRRLSQSVHLVPQSAE